MSVPQLHAPIVRALQHEGASAAAHGRAAVRLPRRGVRQIVPVEVQPDIPRARAALERAAVPMRRVSQKLRGTAQASFASSAVPRGATRARVAAPAGAAAPAAADRPRTAASATARAAARATERASLSRTTET